MRPPANIASVACLSALLAAAALAGCGSSQNGATNGLSSQLNMRPQSTAAGGGRLRAQGRFQGPHGTERFRSLANNVCGAVRSGAPAPSHAPVTPSELAAFTSSADAATQRASRALERIGVAPSLRKPVERLLYDLRRLEGTYAAARYAHGDGKGVDGEMRAIASAEAQATSAAMASGLPGCGPPPAGLPKS